MKENEVLARFMDSVAKEESDGWILIARSAPVVGWYNGFSDLQYYKSWDWLMPVVEKIESLGYYPNSQYLRSEKSKRHFFNITDQHHHVITSQLEDTKINAWLKACVEFIEWYNANKQLDSSTITR